MCAYSIQPSKLYSNVESIMDFGVPNHMPSTNSLFNSHDSKKNTQHKVSIRDGNHLSLLGSGSVNVPNDTLEYVFHVQGIPINLLYIYHA